MQVTAPDRDELRRLAQIRLDRPVVLSLYLDLDPAFTQLWQVAHGIDMHLEGHTHFATVGLSIGRPECGVPTCGRSWIATNPPVVLEHWPVSGAGDHNRFTTVATWRGPYGPVQYGGKTYRLKVHELRRFVELPEQEGLRLPPVKLMRRGELSQDIVEIIL
jgi:hypothetical protein